MSFTRKSILIIVLVLLFMLLGNLCFLGILKLDNPSVTFSQNIATIIENANNLLLVKLGIGLNHFLTFTIGGLVLLHVFYKDKKWRRLGFKAPELPMLIWFIVLLFASLPFLGYVTQTIQTLELPSWLKNHDASQMDTLMKILHMESTSDFLITLLVVAILPAVGEEILFRGIIQKELIHKMKNPHAAILLASIIFSAFHLDFVGFFPKLGIGLILGYAYYITGSIWTPMIIHFINNGMQVVGLYMNERILQNEEVLAEGAELTWVSAAVSLIICLFVVRIILQRKDLIVA